jgi:2-dehydro-3-deoxyphosphogluconate aldolase/(4S)-4-hydroxy-2-oxoglutarate aldolase
MSQDTTSHPEGGSLRAALVRHRVLSVVRAAEIPDPAALCGALLRGGIPVVELTFTTPGVERYLAEAVGYATSAEGAGLVVGAGTVLGVDQARAAIAAGAAFLVTPGVGRATEEVCRVAAGAGVPVMLGAMTPSEVIVATELGAEVVKVFPASLGGPRFLNDLRGPFPDTALVPSGGVTAANARDFLVAGALAVSAGTGVVPPAAVAEGDWSLIENSARQFTAALRGQEPVPLP